MTNNQELELEYTFLARHLPEEISNQIPKRLVDIYIPETVEHAHLRLRQKDDSYQITKKVAVTAGDASTFVETTIPLDQPEFAALSAASSKRIEKDRYLVTIDGFLAEVDVFRGQLQGLVLIDFEFATEEDRAKFTTPRCCLADVTQEEFIAGGLLSGKTYNDISSHLERYNYKALD